MNKPKQIGTAAETAVTRYCQANGFPLAERRALAGRDDLGDILLCPGVIIEVKAHKTYSDNDIRAWLTETRREMFNAKADYGFLVVKRQGKGDAQVGAWWAITEDNGSPMFMFLQDALLRLRRHGWGDEL